MIVVWIILAVIAYLFIGGFIAGLVEEVWSSQYIIAFAWPGVLIALVLIGLVELPIRLGEYVRERRKNK